MSPTPISSVLVVTPYGRSGGYSGPAVFLNRLFDEVSKALPVHVITSVEASPDSGYSWARTTASIMRVDGFSAMKQLTWFVKSFKATLQSITPGTVVHLHGTFFFNLGGAAAAQLKRCPFVLLPLAEGSDLSADGRIEGIPGVRRYKRLLISRAAAGVALSDGIRDELVSSGVRRARTHLIRNSVAADYFTQPTGPTVERKGLLFVGSVGRRKRATFVLEALAALRFRGWDVGATFVGPFSTEDEESEFRTTISTLDLVDHVTLHGHISGDQDLIHAIRSSRTNVFLLPSQKEGLPGAMAEAMAMGYPCLVTDVGAMGEVVQSSGGGIVVQPDPDQIAEEIDGIWRHEQAWNRMSRASREFAQQHFASDAVAEQYLQVISELKDDDAP